MNMMEALHAEYTMISPNISMDEILSHISFVHRNIASSGQTPKYI
jgi:hypothetical protein